MATKKELSHGNGDYMFKSEWKGNPLAIFAHPDDDVNSKYAAVLRVGAGKATRLLLAMHKHGIDAVVELLTEVAGVEKGKVNLGSKKKAESLLSDFE